MKSIRRTGISGLKTQNSKAMEGSAAVNGVQGSLLGIWEWDRTKFGNVTALKSDGLCGYSNAINHAFLMVGIPTIKMVMNGGWFTIAIPTI